MDMKVNTDLIKQLRQARAWSQEELATAASLSLRTVQRVEAEGIASLESKKAIASAFGIDAAVLDDNRASLAATATEQERQKNRGMAGAISGGLAASAAITYGLVSGSLPSSEAGISYAVVGAATGLCCMVIGLAANHRRRV